MNENCKETFDDTGESNRKECDDCRSSKPILNEKAKLKDASKWMNIYHDKWTEAHNKLIDIKSIMEGAKIKEPKKEWSKEKLEDFKNCKNHKYIKIVAGIWECLACCHRLFEKKEVVGEASRCYLIT